ncbi:hypothetical protein [Ktedonobacter sp. SOSP1-52]|uniref:hypothetical protein n=1 Tax=Ktedonobacter sp. SOSP1-52 TaxID=2778366 RepID=UPI0019169B5E|nr:hypothetical protein [Ktedonobacter sp. SOSP1-52]
MIEEPPHQVIREMSRQIIQHEHDAQGRLGIAWRLMCEVRGLVIARDHNASFNIEAQAVGRHGGVIVRPKRCVVLCQSFLHQQFSLFAPFNTLCCSDIPPLITKNAFKPALIA